MPRDRLAELYAESTSAGKHDSDTLSSDRLLSISPEAPIDEVDPALTEFLAKTRDIRDAIATIEKKIDQSEMMSADFLVAVARTSQTELSTALTQLSGDISEQASRVRRELEEIDRQNKIEESKSEGVRDGLSADVRIRKSQHSALARRFLAAMGRFSEVQARCNTRQRDLFARQCRIVSPDISDAAIEAAIAHGVGDMAAGLRYVQASAALQEIQARHVDILRLERSLTELNEMFIDLSLMLESQSAAIDRIELNVSSAGDHVAETAKQLQQARKHKSSANKKKAVMVLAAIAAPLMALPRFL